MRFFALFTLGFFLLFPSGSFFAQTEISIVHPKFTLHGAPEDSALLYPRLTAGVDAVEQFFGQPFSRKFDVYVFPHRASLDKQWQQDWGDPTFQSACWMVASGVAHRLDILSPRVWATEACEHKAADTLALRRLLQHELVHVYHGQHNPKPDFNGMDEMGWWIEGLAVYASEQLDSARLAGLRELIDKNAVPQTLQKFWSGKHKYGLSGSVAAWLDQTYGRSVVVQLLSCTGTDQAMSVLKTDEATVLDRWQKFWSAHH
ncbi:MAG: hypothetical protein DYG98_09730 [Haliscomenobacteraceae bacterium CHB4]|nr:hypothetical protein [Saprospiraceae bacterium]MCE7923327.1 hypothetical protein [Haliscomenobacteraceae bacterium CHB4]